MDKKINLEEILESEVSGHMWAIIEEDGMMKEWIIDAMIKACKQALELAAENAKLKCTNNIHPKGYPWFMHNPNGLKENNDLMIIVNKQSILDIINQIK